jgi:phosphinothricin acetyltransferase
MDKASGAAAHKIYNDCIRSGEYAFAAETADFEKWYAGFLPNNRAVAKENGKVIGFAALSPIYRAEYFSGIAAVSVYVEKSRRRLGAGLALLNTLIDSAGEHGLWTLHSYIFTENLASVRLHERAGFREAGMFIEAGTLNGKWKDVFVYEFTLNKHKTR